MILLGLFLVGGAALGAGLATTTVAIEWVIAITFLYSLGGTCLLVGAGVL